MLKDGSWTAMIDRHKKLGDQPICTSNPFVLAIEEMLVLHAKSFAFKLSLKYTQKLPRIALYDDGCEVIGVSDPSVLIDSPYEARTRSILSKDKKLMKLLKSVAQDFEVGYKDLLWLKES
jgi:hypothetical protein